MTQSHALDQEQIYQLLASEILRFEHKPGETLSENHLCLRFSLSRTPVRSILQRLQENGLVHIIPRKGSIVTKIDFEIVNQLIYERVAVESMVLRDFIRTCSPIDVEKVRFAFEQLRQLALVYENDREHFDAKRFLEIDLMMHETWFKATNKGYLWKKLSGVQSDYTRFCTLDIIDGSNVPDVMKDHEAMLALIDSRSTEGIEQLMSRHLYGGVRRLGSQIFTRFADYFVSADGGEHDDA